MTKNLFIVAFLFNTVLCFTLNPPGTQKTISAYEEVIKKYVQRGDKHLRAQLGEAAFDWQEPECADLLAKIENFKDPLTLRNKFSPLRLFSQNKYWATEHFNRVVDTLKIHLTPTADNIKDLAKRYISTKFDFFNQAEQKKTYNLIHDFVEKSDQRTVEKVKADFLIEGDVLVKRHRLSPLRLFSTNKFFANLRFQEMQRNLTPFKWHLSIK